mmetsp:Transcript_12172/g.28396  ORF Transcript_12172/g.28396 Transcript_12172/m.28396 type:complete len:293 (+) Transcript_12172:134-1012(+)
MSAGFFATVVVKPICGTLFLVGVALLLPGFWWSAPVRLSVEFDPSGQRILAPVVGPRYAEGVHALISGMGLILLSSIIDLSVHCCSLHSGGPGRHRAVEPSQSTGALLVEGAPSFGRPRQLSPRWSLAAEVVVLVIQVLAATLNLLCCIVALPRFALAKPPARLAGMPAPDLSNTLLKAGSALYLLTVVLAMSKEVTSIRGAWRIRKSAAVHLFTLSPLLLLIVAQSFLFANTFFPARKALEAANLRIAAAFCLLFGVMPLFALGLRESYVKARDVVKPVSQSPPTTQVIIA